MEKNWIVEWNMYKDPMTNEDGSVTFKNGIRVPIASCHNRDHAISYIYGLLDKLSIDFDDSCVPKGPDSEDSLVFQMENDTENVDFVNEMKRLFGEDVDLNANFTLWLYSVNIVD